MVSVCDSVYRKNDYGREDVKMDAKEALRYFKEIEFVDLGVDEAGREDPHIVQAREAKQAAISALEKVETLEAENVRLRERETPKEPIRKEGARLCPNCNHYIGNLAYDSRCGYTYKPTNYCSGCGQAIKNDKE